MSLPLDQRPVVVAIAGPNGAGKTTFYHAHFQPAGLRFVNADVLAVDKSLALIGRNQRPGDGGAIACAEQGHAGFVASLGEEDSIAADWFQSTKPEILKFKTGKFPLPRLPQ